jgi:hypothetical protein
MNMPGFTAEASLFSVSTRYQAAAEATVYGGLVQPARGSDMFNPDRPIPRLCSWGYGCRWIPTFIDQLGIQHFYYHCGVMWVC